GPYGSNGYEDCPLEDSVVSFWRPGPGGLFLLSPDRGHVADLVHDLRVRQRGHVPQLPALGHVPEEPPHDLPGAGLGKVLGEDDRMGPGELADHLGHVLPELLSDGLVADLA